jgi:hypothetical protein
MKVLASLLALGVLSTLAHAEDVWRWKDANGTIWYSNRTSVAPPDAVPVTTRLTIEATRLPDPGADLAMSDGEVVDVRDQPAPARSAAQPPHRIYTEQRLRFGCYSSGILYAGGWSHPDDIAAVGNCLPYLLGPEAWLNAARAELALREHGIDWRQLVSMYVAEGGEAPRGRLTHVSRRY